METNNEEPSSGASTSDLTDSPESATTSEGFTKQESGEPQLEIDEVHVDSETNQEPISKKADVEPNTETSPKNGNVGGGREPENPEEPSNMETINAVPSNMETNNEEPSSGASTSDLTDSPETATTSEGFTKKESGEPQMEVKEVHVDSETNKEPFSKKADVEPNTETSPKKW